MRASIEPAIIRGFLLKCRRQRARLPKATITIQSNVVSGKRGSATADSLTIFSTGTPETVMAEPPVALMGLRVYWSPMRNLGLIPFTDLLSMVFRTSRPPMTRHPLPSSIALARYHFGPILIYETEVSTEASGDMILYLRLTNLWTISFLLISSLSSENWLHQDWSESSIYL